MHDHRRLEQLHVLIDRLERLPASRHRDWMLLEVRARAADVESDVRPSPIRRLDPEVSSAAPEAVTPVRPPRAHGSTPFHRATARTGWARNATSAAATPARARPPVFGQASRANLDDGIDLLIEGGRLCLDDPPLAGSEAHLLGASPPWARGLRG